MKGWALIQYYIQNPSMLFFKVGNSSFLRGLSDEQYIKLYYKSIFGRSLNLDSPKTYNEKLQWLKLYDRKPIYTKMVDKYEVKKLVTELIGAEYVIPTLGVWDTAEEIDFASLPNQFVLKCTHDSGGLIICKDKKSLNVDAARKKMRLLLKNDYYSISREWPYKDVKPRIIAEQYMEDAETKELRDYKFFAFDGDVKALFIATERGSQEETKFDFFDADFNHLPFLNGHPNAAITPSKPRQFELMKELTSRLSVGIPQIRIDWYEANGKVYFGEFTFFHWSGFKPFDPEEWDYTFGSWIKLPNNDA